MPCRRPRRPLRSQGVGAHPGDLLEVEGAPFPASRGVHAAFDQRPPGLEDAYPDLEGLGLPDRVVDDIDAPGGPWAGPRGVQHPAGPVGQLLDDGQAGLVIQHLWAPSCRASAACASKRAITATSTSGYRAAAPPPRRSQRAGPVHDDLAPGGGGWRVTEWSETAKGSAKTAFSSGTESGTGISIESCAAISSA